MVTTIESTSGLGESINWNRLHVSDQGIDGLALFLRVNSFYIFRAP